MTILGAASNDTFTSTALVLAIVTVVAFVAHRARQPLIVAFIAVGVMVGPSGFEIITESEPLELFADLGIAVLLFLVGLKLDLHLVRSMGKVALATGFGQIGFTALFGFLLSSLLGLSAQESLYVAIALTFSSTIIIVKILSDKRELEKLHGRIALGFLIVQDIVVVIVMVVLSTLGTDSDSGVGWQIGRIFLTGVGLLVGTWVLTFYVIPRLLAMVASSQELLIITSVAWAVSVAAFSDWLGFSVEVGAFLAGFALASTNYRESIASSLSGLRDFLLLFFFIDLGIGLDFSAIGEQIVPAIVLSIFVLIGKPLIILMIMGAMRYPKRVSFLAGVAAGQISEFSLILIALGLELGHVDNGIVGLVTLVGLVTIGLSTYLINYSNQLFDRLKRPLGFFERERLRDDLDVDEDVVDFIVFGYGRFGRHLVEQLARSGHRVLVVDWDPYGRLHVTDPELASLISMRFGDADDPEFPGTLPINSATWIVSTIARVDTSLVLARSLRRWGTTARIAVTCLSTGESLKLRQDVEDGVVDLVLQPFSDAADDAIDALMRHGG
ncbi:MAG: cation:proton antiporter [Actinomycetota bacterium]|nr:cation:proton antiporter [Actinomycetota bacterium]MDA2972711.1 cation:proton antiporter [Actinomycetota bacterium]MDA3002191.1 cation:proton antiporter [Actinomycetota bacterium]